jgi:PAS domain S-box-containing protein
MATDSSGAAPQRSHEIGDEQILEKELETLQQVATQLITASGMEALYEQILDTALSILHADLASIQMFHAERGTAGELKLLGYRGFSPDSAKNFVWVGPHKRTTCGEALRTRRRVVVPDVRKCDFMVGSMELEAFIEEGVHAAQSVPLLSRSGSLLGMISTYWRQPHEIPVTELRGLDILARLAAEVIERAKADEALWEKQQHLASIYDTVRDIIFHLAVESEGQYRFLSVNAAFLKCTGLPREAVVGKLVSEVIPEPSLQLVLSKYRQAIDEHATILWEETTNYPTGLLTGEVGITPVYDKNGECTHIVGSVHDITERKVAENALRESEERFRHMANAVPAMIWVTGLDKTTTFVNQQWLDFTGRSIEQELGLGWADGLHPEDAHRAFTAFSSAFDGRRTLQNECRFRRADGQYRWILDIGSPLYRNGEFIGMIGSCLDITEIKQIEERLRASEARLMSAQRLARLGSWERDAGTGITDFSNEMLRILGRPENPPATLVDFLEMVHPEDRDFVRDGAFKARSMGIQEAGDYRIVRADGEVRFVRSIIEAIHDERGAVVRVLGATQDITDFKRAQEESFARQKLESVGTLASGIAHDFNNLLGGVLAQADLALDEIEAGGRPEDELNAIRNAAVRGSEVVRELMIYAGKDSQLTESVDVSRAVKEMLELLKVSISKHATLETDLTENLPTIRANPAQIQQIVMNLVVNASEALGEQDGVIRVTTSYLRLGKDAQLPDADGLSADGLSEDGRILLEISDTGQGMSAETRARIFDPFFTTKSAGHGLGLAIVNGIVRSLRGKIQLMSDLGRGSTFRISLPCDASGRVQERIPPSQEIAESPALTSVLVLEDEEILRQAVARAMRKSGFEVLEASNGSVAIEMLRANGKRIDLMLLDVTFPGASINDVIREYGRVRPDGKVILTSAYSEEMTRTTISAAQIYCFIRKPFYLAELVKTLRDALSS